MKISSINAVLLKKLYSLCMYGAAWLIWPCIIMVRPANRRRWKERLGLWPSKSSLQADEVVWFHGASVGEIQALLPVITRWRESNPLHKVLLTATNPQGLEGVLNSVDFAYLLPIDSSIFFSSALRDVVIKQCVITEAELWPGMLCYLADRHIPIYLINARMSSRSFKRYKKFTSLTAILLNKFTGVFAGEEISAQRFLELGIDASKLKIIGNSKYDRLPKVVDREAARKMKELYVVGAGNVLTLGSLRPGEESFFIQAFQSQPNLLKEFIIIVVPRHQEYFNYFYEKFAALAAAAGNCQIQRSSEMKRPLQQSGILIIDSIGNLESIYSFSDIAFVGGTLLPEYGGHNILEPSMYAVPVLTGPYGENIELIREEMKSKNACIVVTTALDIITTLGTSTNQLQAIGQRGFHCWQRHTGVTNKIVELL